MENSTSPNISSFVIRFVQDQPQNSEDPPTYRGSIHHVQTNQEIPFTQWQDAVDFIRRFVTLDLDDTETES